MREPVINVLNILTPSKLSKWLSKQYTWLQYTIKFSMDDNANILSPSSKTVDTKFIKPVSISF